MKSGIIFEKCQKGDFTFVSKTNIASEEEIGRLVSIYQSSFAIFSSATPCLQSYTKEEIRSAIEDESNIKYIIFYGALPVGFGLATTNLDKVPWINAEFYQSKFNEQMDAEILFYFKGISIAPEFQDWIIGTNGNKKVKLVAELFNFIARSFPSNSILAFDCSETANFWLCEAIMSSTGCFEMPQVNNGKTFIDRQIYHVLHKTGIPKNLFEGNG